jgi:hypothetical protein
MPFRLESVTALTLACKPVQPCNSCFSIPSLLGVTATYTPSLQSDCRSPVSALLRPTSPAPSPRGRTAAPTPLGLTTQSPGCTAPPQQAEPSSWYDRSTQQQQRCGVTVWLCS